MSDAIAGGRRVVIIGGSFAGLGAAYTLRNRLPPEDEITVVSQSRYFVFAPSLVWAAFGRSLLNLSFDLEAALIPRGIHFVRASVREVRVDDHVVAVEDEEIPYDKLLVGTGGRPDAQAIPGLAGMFRAASWIVGEDSAMEARNTLRAFFANPGPIVVGSAPGASYLSAAYEIAFALDAELRKRGLRDRVPMTFVTAEARLGDLGFGQTAASRQLEKLLRERNITALAASSVARVEPHAVKLADAGTLDAAAVIIMPPFTGSVNIWKSARLTDESGLIPVSAQYRHTREADVYAAGVASYFAEPIPSLGGYGAPHTGYLSVRMGAAAGENIAASLGHGAPAGRTLPYFFDVRVIDSLNAGLILTSSGNTTARHTATRLPGTSAHYLKGAIERYLLWRLRNGRMDLP